MKQIEPTDLKKHKFYMIYYDERSPEVFQCEGQTFYFFSIRSKLRNGFIDVMLYGVIHNDNPTKQVIASYYKIADTLSVVEPHNYSLFELDMDDYAMHIASETI
jgi:hypothetical protein